jgi:hypothetical protein
MLVALIPVMTKQANREFRQILSSITAERDALVLASGEADKRGDNATRNECARKAYDLGTRIDVIKGALDARYAFKA